MIKRVLVSAQMFSVASLLFLPIGICAECGPLSDGSFEGGTSSASWAATSTNFGTPLCDAASCGGPPGAPHTGSWWAWFGGAASQETGSLTQNVLVPLDSLPRLNFYLQNPLTSKTGTGVDFLRVTIDGHQVFNMLAGDSLYTSGYALVDLDLAPYADGKCHSLSFESTTFYGTTNIFVDDVAIASCSATVRVGETPYGSVQAAMDAAGDGSEISATAHFFKENLLFSQPGRVTFKGGYDCAFAKDAGNTAIGGEVTISGMGTLEVENVIIR